MEIKIVRTKGRKGELRNLNGSDCVVRYNGIVYSKGYHPTLYKYGYSVLTMICSNEAIFVPNTTEVVIVEELILG